MATKIPLGKYLGGDLFADVGITHVTPEERAEFMAKIAEVIQHRIEFRVMDSLTDEQKDELERLSSGEAKGSEIMAFFEQNLPSFDTLAQEEVAKYRKELVEKMSA